MQNDTSLVFLYYYYYYFLQSILAKEQAMKNRKKMRQCHHTFKCSINTLVIIFKKNPLDLITFYIWWIGNKFCLESMNILLLTGTQLFWPPPPHYYIIKILAGWLLQYINLPITCKCLTITAIIINCCDVQKLASFE